MRTRAARAREPVELIGFSRWVCRACLGADVVLLALLLAGALGWGPSADAVAGVGALVMLGVLVVLVRLRSATRLAYPAGFPAAPEGASAPPTPAGDEDQAGWLSWSIPSRAEAVGRARTFRDLTATLKRGGPVAAADRTTAGVHAYRQVATYTNGTAGNSLLLVVASLQVVQRDSLGWPYVGAALLLAAAVLFVLNLRSAGRWRQIASDHELVEPPTRRERGGRPRGIPPRGSSEQDRPELVSLPIESLSSSGLQSLGRPSGRRQCGQQRSVDTFRDAVEMHTVPVLVGASYIEDGEAAPVLGQDVSWPVRFGEVSEDEDPDPGLCRWWEVTAAANGADAGQRSQPICGPPEGPVFWSTLLHGPGWIAGWNAPRRVRGLVQLRGQLWAADEHAVGTTARISGRIARIRVVTEAVTLVRVSGGLSSRVVVGSRAYHDVHTSPLVFGGDDRTIPPSAPNQPLPTSINQGVELPPGALVRQLGILTDLELSPS